MSRCLISKFGLLMLIGLFLPSTPAAVEARKSEVKKSESAEPSLTDLSMEVAALQTLREFKFTSLQMAQLKKLAAETVRKPRKRKPGKATKEFRDALAAFHDALVDDLEDDEVDPLEDQVDDLREAEKPVLDDDVEITEAARKRAPELLRRLKPSQLASYIAANEDEINDPLDQLLDALNLVRGMKVKRFQEWREEISEEVSRLLAGLDEEKADKIRVKVIALFSKVRGLKDNEFKKQLPELEKEARRIVGDIHPSEILRHAAEHALAEMLSNPRLGEAITARLKI
jgi:hypothetical protein